MTKERGRKNEKGRHSQTLVQKSGSARKNLLSQKSGNTVEQLPTAGEEGAPTAATQQLSATKQTKENKTDKANSDNAAKHPPERRDDGMDFIHLRGDFHCIHPVFIEELQGF